MRRHGMLLVVAGLAFVAGMLAAGSPLHAHRDEVTALGSFSSEAGQTRDGKPSTVTLGWVVRDGGVYQCSRTDFPDRTPFKCRRQELVFE